IVLPEGAEDLRFSVISGDLAHISFKLDGSEYTLRASKLKDDFSGLYGEKTYEEKLDSGALLETINASGPIWQRLGWQEGSARYMLLSESEDTEGVKKAYESIKGL
ncbi:MAG: hypothetical protein IJM17_05650, partial [Firmicutes bacterium]|nr:hypothetical protein [Bacillota bacterium]